MGKINDIKKYPVKTEMSGTEIIIGSEKPNSGNTINIDIKGLSEYISRTIDVADYNGTVGKNDSPNGHISGYWIANEKGVYPNFGNVENIWDTATITLTNGVFTIKEFIQVDKPQYNDDFII